MSYFRVDLSKTRLVCAVLLGVQLMSCQPQNPGDHQDKPKSSTKTKAGSGPTGGGGTTVETPPPVSTLKCELPEKRALEIMTRVITKREANADELANFAVKGKTRQEVLNYFFTTDLRYAEYKKRFMDDIYLATFGPGRDVTNDAAGLAKFNSELDSDLKKPDCCGLDDDPEKGITFNGTKYSMRKACEMKILRGQRNNPIREPYDRATDPRPDVVYGLSRILYYNVNSREFANRNLCQSYCAGVASDAVAPSNLVSFAPNNNFSLSRCNDILDHAARYNLVTFRDNLMAKIYDEIYATTRPDARLPAKEAKIQAWAVEWNAATNDQDRLQEVLDAEFQSADFASFIDSIREKPAGCSEP